MYVPGAPLRQEPFRPGERVPESGIYRIEHDKHRMMHHATLTVGARFPRCKQCGDAVRFISVRPTRGAVLPFRETEILEEYPLQGGLKVITG